MVLQNVNNYLPDYMVGHLLKMRVVHYPEKSVIFIPTTVYHIPEGSNLHSHCFEIRKYKNYLTIDNLRCRMTIVPPSWWENIRESNFITCPSEH
jgi:hypothetical protein